MVKFVNSCQFYACFDCVVINHQKGGDCNEHGTIYTISSDFGARMTTQSMGLIVFVKKTFLDLRDEVKRPCKVKHEERTQKNAEMD